MVEIAEQMPFFVYATLRGEEVELIPDGRNSQVTYESTFENIFWLI